MCVLGRIDTDNTKCTTGSNCGVKPAPILVLVSPLSCRNALIWEFPEIGKSHQPNYVEPQGYVQHENEC